MIAYSKVGKLDNPAIMIQEEVCGFDIAVHETVRVKIVKALGHLFDNTILRLFLR